MLYGEWSVSQPKIVMNEKYRKKFQEKGGVQAALRSHLCFNIGTANKNNPWSEISTSRAGFEPAIFPVKAGHPNH